MAKSFILSTLLIFTLLLPAQQTVTINFTSASLDGFYVPFDAVNVTNVTRNWSVTLAYPDTTMVLTSYDGMPENSIEDGFWSEVYPNPFSGQADVVFKMNKSGFLSAKLINLRGVILSEYCTYLDRGMHQIKMSVEKPQMAFLVVKTEQNQYIKKVLNIGYCKTNGVTIIRMSDENNFRNSNNDGEFVVGDVMTYEAIKYTYGGSEIITQAQYNDESIVLTFPISKPVVWTDDVSQITSNSAVSGGVVTSDGGGTVTAFGICWSTIQDPTIYNAHTYDGMGVGSFTSHLTSLTSNTTYYVRAYSTNEVGTAYGNQVVFTTEAPTPPDGAIAGLFSVNSSGNQVWFSQGNLQYIGSATIPYWKFADHQWVYFGEIGQGCNLESVDRDLFGWGTSGYDHGAICYQPWSTSTSYSDYFAYGLPNMDLNDETKRADWGHNVISNGGNTENMWRTLTKDEWNYVLNTRNTLSGARYAKAQVNGVNGLILLPDNWNLETYNINYTNQSSCYYSVNVISQSEWDDSLEANGAVFLPAAGMRQDTSIIEMGLKGQYWSATRFHEYGAYIIGFNSSDVYPDATGYYGFRENGHSVRLVSDVE